MAGEDLALDTAPASVIDLSAFRDCCGSFATGMTVSAFMSVSLDPPLIFVLLDRQSGMLGKAQKSPCFAANILSQNMPSHALHFAERPDSALTDLFLEEHGLPVLRNTATVIMADMVQQVEAGIIPSFWTMPVI